jgi:dTMP kinase
MPQNKLIVLEGIDGSGKSTQTQLVKDYFEFNNLSYSYFHFPMYGHNQFSDIISLFLRGEFGNVNEVDSYFIATQYAMDQWKFKTELEYSLSRGHVLLDRYVFSNLAYQGAKMNTIGESQVIREWIYDLSFKFLKMPYPDLTIFFDVPIEIIKKRLKEKRIENRDYLNGKQDIHESDIEYQETVRDMYRELQGYNGYHIIECADSSMNIYNPHQLFWKYEDLLKRVLIN